MSNIQADIFQGEFFAIHTDQGIEIVPVRETNRTMSTPAEYFAEYVKGNILQPEELVNPLSGWIGRLVNPATLRTTDYQVYKSKELAQADLIGFHKNPVNYQNRTISAQFIGQIYRNDQDDFPIELDPIEFDATESVLRAGYEDIMSLLAGDSDHYIIDGLVPTTIRDEHNGPFRVENLENSIRAFFGLECNDVLTLREYEDAREALRLDEQKTFQVMVERTETRHVWIEVSATSSREAEAQALEKAGDIDFYSEAQASDPVYEVSEVREEVEFQPTQRARPRM